MQPEVKQLDRRIRRTKSNFKHALIKLMNDKTFHKITVTDIVDYADYNRTTFYRHYQYKEKLAEELVDDMVDGLIKAFRYPYQVKNKFNLAALDPSDIVIFDHIKKHQDFYRIWQHSEGIPGFQSVFIETLGYMIRKDVIQLDQKQSEQINIDLLITYRSYGIWGLIINWIKNDFSIPTEYMSEQLIAILKYNSITNTKIKTK